MSKHHLLNCSGLILAGGSSTRFGSDKASFKLDGMAMINYVAKQLKIVCKDVIAVARSEQYTDEWLVDYVVHDDPDLPEGPLRGMVAGLAQSVYPGVFIVSCDTPFIQPALLTALYKLKKPGTQAVVPEWGGRIQPLTAFYDRNCTAKLKSLLTAGEQSATRALKHLENILIVEEAVCRKYDQKGESFININSPEDYADRLRLRKNS